MPKPVSLLTRQRQSRAQLSRKQVKFVAEYAHLENGTEAARRAGYKGSDNVLGVQAHHNLKHPKIASAIKQELAKIDIDVTPVRSTRIAVASVGVPFSRCCCAMCFFAISLFATCLPRAVLCCILTGVPGPTFAHFFGALWTYEKKRG